MRLRNSASLRQWLSRWLAIQTFLALGAVCIVVYVLTNLNLSVRQEALLQQKRAVIEHLVDEFTSKGDFLALDHKLTDFFYGAPEFMLRLEIGGTVYLYGESGEEAKISNQRKLIFALPSPNTPNVKMLAELYLNTTADIHLRTMLAWTLLGCALIGAFIVSIMGDVLVRRALSSLKSLGQQAEKLSADRIGERLDESGLASEIRPLVVQFNAVLQRLESAYIQMEGFNADVAHELRTPLATLMGETEFALVAKRSTSELCDILGSNLEELQRMTVIVNDMLFLSQAGRGLRIRSTDVFSLSGLVKEVFEYHEAEAAEAEVTLKVEGNSIAHVDRSLFQRAVSNLVSNAIRYSLPATDVIVTIGVDAETIRITVLNTGKTIEAQYLPRLFLRFYRLDPARTRAAGHHGLGLAIVAAIARMHGGEPYASSDPMGTRIGFTISSRPLEREDA